MIRYIVLWCAPYEGMWPHDSQGERDENPIPTFETRDEANAYANKVNGWTQGEREVLAVQVSPA